MLGNEQKNSVFVAAVKEAGQSNFAARIKRTQQAVSKMLREKSECPAEYVVALEEATGGKYPRQVLRPDLYTSSTGNP
jgi:DNA-binding transcriptional regulator YdaS (Cro superfamily)